MKALDLFCGAGGASMGLHRAGYDVTGVDINPQPRYPFTFVQADAMTFDLSGYDLIWASPPCQRYSEHTPKAFRAGHPDLIAAIRARLVRTEAPFIIENVAGAKSLLRDPLMLCGTMFDLPLERHRYFEVQPNALLLSPRSCNHEQRPVVLHAGSNTRRSAERGFTVTDFRRAMGIDWMTKDELFEAIPPAYAEHIARYVSARECAA